MVVHSSISVVQLFPSQPALQVQVPSTLSHDFVFAVLQGHTRAQSSPYLVSPHSEKKKKKLSWFGSSNSYMKSLVKGIVKYSNL